MPKRRVVSCALIVVAWCAGANASAGLLSAQDTWTCELDLHQGDTGVLEFALKGTAIAGRIEVRRGTMPEPMVTRIRGTWTGEEIRFTRTLSPATSIQPFVGVALQADGDVRMAGRFAASFAGIWSASCPAEGKTLPATEGRGDAGGGTPGSDPAPVPAPAAIVRLEPAQPSTRDSVKLVVNATSPRGMRVITIQVNGRIVATCNRTNVCDVTGGPYGAGPLQWEVVARAMDGQVTRREGRVLVRAVTGPGPGGPGPGPATGTCSIAGAAVGPRAGVANVFGVALFGPNNDGLFRVRQPMGSGQFRFDKLPPGRYLLVPDTKADIAVTINPSRRTVTCAGSAITGVNFEFR